MAAAARNDVSAAQSEPVADYQKIKDRYQQPAEVSSIEKQPPAKISMRQKPASEPLSAAESYG